MEDPQILAPTPLVVRTTQGFSTSQSSNKTVIGVGLPVQLSSQWPLLYGRSRHFVSILL